MSSLNPLQTVDSNVVVPNDEAIGFTDKLHVPAIYRMWKQLREDELFIRLMALYIPELQKLHGLKMLGWSHKELDACFSDMREDKKPWYIRHMFLFAELEDTIKCVPPSGEFKFLDLGCSPGGFAGYILGKNSRARGVGITLSPKQGGPAFELIPRLHARFRLHTGDITRYKLHPMTKETIDALRPLPPLPDDCRENDMVILDARPFLQQKHQANGHRLLISQVIVVLRTLNVGGTIVMTLDHPERLITAQLLFFLTAVCSKVTPFKSERTLQIQSDFLVVAQGFGRGPKADKRSEYLKTFEALWFEISFGGPKKQGRALTAQDLDFVISCDEIMDRHLDELLKLAMDPWTKQAHGLYEWFCDEGILARVDSVATTPSPSTPLSAFNEDLCVSWRRSNAPSPCSMLGDELAKVLQLEQINKGHDWEESGGSESEHSEPEICADPAWILL